MKVTRTKEELELEVKNGADEIIVEGELANYLHKTKKVNQLSKYAIAILVIAIGATMATGGAASFASGPIAAISGVEIALIIAILFVGITLVIAVWKDYEEVEFDFGPPPKIKLKKKR